MITSYSKKFLVVVVSKVAHFDNLWDPIIETKSE